MTKQERKKIIKALDYFLDDDPDNWINGIDELYLLVFGEKYSEIINLGDGKMINIFDLLRR